MAAAFGCGISQDLRIGVRGCEVGEPARLERGCSQHGVLAEERPRRGGQGWSGSAAGAPIKRQRGRRALALVENSASSSIPWERVFCSGRCGRSVRRWPGPSGADPPHAPGSTNPTSKSCTDGDGVFLGGVNLSGRRRAMVESG